MRALLALHRLLAYLVPLNETCDGARSARADSSIILAVLFIQYNGFPSKAQRFFLRVHVLIPFISVYCQRFSQFKLSLTSRSAKSSASIFAAGLAASNANLSLILRSITGEL